MIHLSIQGTLKNGTVNKVKAITESLVADTRNHDGVERYEFYFDKDQSRFFGQETYRDAAALGNHMETMDQAALGELMGHMEGMAITVFGTLPDEMRTAFEEGYGATVTTSIAGFSR